MDCGSFLKWLGPWVDGELDLVLSLDMEKHLTECSSCFAEYTALKEQHSRLAQADLRFLPPATLEAKILRIIDGESPVPAKVGRGRDKVEPGSRRVFRSRPLIAAGAVCAVLVVSILLLGWEQMRSRYFGLEALSQELADSHFRSLQDTHLMDVASTDQHTVKPWFAGKLDFSPTVEDLADFGFPLVGGRLDYVHQHSVAALIYKRNLHVINLFCWPDRDLDGKDLFYTSNRGYHILIWKRGGFAWSAVSDLNEAELRRFAQLLRAPHG